MTTPYVPTVWNDDNPPDVDAVHLNHAEQGIKTATDAVISHDASLTAIGARVTTIEQNGGGGGGGRRFTFDAISRGAKGDGATDNTRVLQDILDQIKGLGYGELYLPGAPGTVYKTKGLYVMPHTRVVSDPGVILQITAPSGVAAVGPSGHSDTWVSGDIRWRSYDTDITPSDGLFCGIQVRTGSDGRGGAVVVDSWNAPDGEIHLEGIAVKGGPIVLSAVQRASLIDVHVQDAFFGIALTGSKSGQGDVETRDVLIDNCSVKNVGRNGIELSSTRDVIVRGCTIDGVTGKSGIDQDPGVGIEQELESSGAVGWNTKILDNTIRNCGGAGIAFIRSGNPANANFCIARGNYIEYVALVAYGGGQSPVNVGTRGAVWFAGQGAGGEEVIIVEGNQARNVSAGGFLATAPNQPDGTVIGYDGTVVATSNVCKGGSTGESGTFKQGRFKSNNIGV